MSRRNPRRRPPAVEADAEQPHPGPVAEPREAAADHVDVRFLALRKALPAIVAAFVRPGSLACLGETRAEAAEPLAGEPQGLRRPRGRRPRRSARPGPPSPPAAATAARSRRRSRRRRTSPPGDRGRRAGPSGSCRCDRRPSRRSGCGAMGARGAMGLEAVDRVSGVEPQGQVAVEHRLAVTVVDEEQRRPVSPLADQHQGVARVPATTRRASSLDGRGLDQRGQRQPVAESPLDPGEQVDGQQRRPAQVEVIVVDPHGLEPQQVGPDLGQLEPRSRCRGASGAGPPAAGHAVAGPAWRASRTCSGTVQCRRRSARTAATSRARRTVPVPAPPSAPSSLAHPSAPGL